MDNTKRFSGKGAIYAKARPGYAPALFAYLEQELQVPRGAVFADIGAGTGIFSRQLLQAGYRVTAVEPNEDMRCRAEQALNGTAGYQSVNGTADHTGLEDESVDYVTAAQAFHWFDPVAFRRECRRILKPGGQVLLVYNTRDLQAPCTRALAELWHTYSDHFVGFSNGMSEEKCRAFFADKCRVFRAENSQTYDREGYVARLLSSSHAPGSDQAEYADFLAAAGALFDRLQMDGRLTVPMYTVVYIGAV